MIDRMMGYLPGYYRKSALTKQIQTGAAVELGSISDTLDYIETSLYVMTADAKAIARYEQIVGLRPGEYNLETRRGRVLARLRGYETSTVAVIESVASRLLGCPVTAVEVNSEYRFYVTFERTLDSKSDIGAMIAAINEIKPAHLGWWYVDALRMPSMGKKVNACGAIYNPAIQTILPPIERTYISNIKLFTAIIFTDSITTNLPAIPAKEDYSI